MEESTEKCPAAGKDTSTRQIFVETKLYRKRWVILLLFVIQNVAAKIPICSNGVINDVYKEYFKISYYIIDWFTLIQIPAMIMSAFILAFFTFNSVIDSRNLFVLLSSCAIFSFAFSMIAFLHTPLYFLFILCQFVISFGAESSQATISAIATNWFPENQIGFALSIKTMAYSLGCILGFLLPSQIFVPNVHTKNNSSDIVYINVSTNIQSNKWHYETRSKFLILYGSLLVVSVVVLVLVLLFVSDKPPIPPTIAQAMKPPQTRRKMSELIKNSADFFKETKNVLSSKLVFQLAIILSILYSCGDVQNLLVGQIVRESFNSYNHHETTDAAGGYVLALHGLGCVAGSFASGKLIDLYKRHKLILNMFLLLSASIVACLAIAQLYHNILTIFVSNTLLGFSICACFVPIFDMLLQHTYPRNTSFVVLIFVSVSTVASVAFGEACRLLLNYFNGIAVFVFMCIFLMVAFISGIFLKPTYQRPVPDNIEQNDGENIPLMAGSN